MEKEPVLVRHRRISKVLITAEQCAMQKINERQKVSHETFIDALFALYDECSKEALKKDPHVAYFVNKYKGFVTELRSLRVHLEDFELKSVIGRGQFGEVRLVKEKNTGDLYAMKILSKAQTLNNPSAALFEEERDILSRNNSEWLTKLQYALQDKQCLYFVMEFHAGGDLRALLERSENYKLSTDTARFYIAETLLAIRALHQLGYVHRDIKPANVLLDRCGHVKLADFGSAAKMGPDKLVNTAMPVGTPDYVAPEVLKSAENPGKPYGTECDFWSLGILSYALVVGTAPFASNRTAVTYSRILNHEDSDNRFISYPDSVSVTDSLKDLINKLLTNASSRLDFHGTRSHVFFLELDFDSLRQTVPPFVPVLKSDEDLSNFAINTNKESVLPLTPKSVEKEFSGRQLPFIGFTFIRDLSSEKTVESKQMGDSLSEKMLRRENQDLLKKLFAVEQENSKYPGHEHWQRMLEKSEEERICLQRDLANQKTKSAVLRKALEADREDRKRAEEQALEIARLGKQAMERESRLMIAHYKSQLEQLTDELTESHTVCNELASRVDRAETEVEDTRRELARVRASEAEAQRALSKALKVKRRSIAGFESTLDDISNKNQAQVLKWEARAACEEAAHLKTEALYSELQHEFALKEEAWIREESKLCNIIKNLESKLRDFNEKMKEFAELEGKLVAEQKEVNRLKIRLTTVEYEMNHCIKSSAESEAAVAVKANQLQQLEHELKQLTQEKITLQTSLQGTKERDRETRAKLADLEKMLEKFEQEVVKLENENKELKLAATKTNENMPLQQQVEYEQKILLYEQQIKKLEEQNEKLREKVADEKLQCRTAQTNLWKLEKELSNAKIDIRILQREAKTVEQTLEKCREELTEHTEKNKAVLTELEELKMKLEEKEKLALDFEKIKNDLNEALNREKSLEQEKNKLFREINLLKEAGTMFDEQLDDYEQFTSLQSEKIKTLQEENEKFQLILNESKEEISLLRAQLDEEKAKKAQTDSEKTSLNALLADNNDIIKEFQWQNDCAAENIKKLNSQLSEALDTITELNDEIQRRESEREALSADLTWIKKECTELRTAFFSVKEQKYKLEHELEEKVLLKDALYERVRELEGVISELEAFHKQREIKDEATKHQQNKLISFLQSKLDDYKSKKTLAEKLFGQRRKEKIMSPPPSATSPRSCGLKREAASPSTLPTPKSKSPAKVQRTLSTPRMKPKNSHSFELKRWTQEAKCINCLSSITRTCRQAMVCRDCHAICHPKCALSTPQNCQKADGDKGNKTVVFRTPGQGWAHFMGHGEKSWARRYLKVTSDELQVFELEEDSQPRKVIDLKGQVLVGDVLDANELPSVASNDYLYIIKIAVIPDNTCWPKETHYIKPLSAADRTQWITALQMAALRQKDEDLDAGGNCNIMNKVTPVLTKLPFICYCAHEFDNEVLLLGTNEGLYSIRSPNASPVYISGIESVCAIEISVPISLALLLDNNQLFTTDYRILMSNAEAAACANPAITTQSFDSDLDNVIHFKTSEEINGGIYLAVATSSSIIIFMWCHMNSRFVKQRELQNADQTTICFEFCEDSLIIGYDSFIRISLANFEMHQVINRPELVKSLRIINAVPMKAFKTSLDELLLCYYAIGLFVDKNGVKTRCDLKWTRFPKTFEIIGQYLFIISFDGVEIIRLPARNAETGSLASLTTTESFETSQGSFDSTFVPIKAPSYLGSAPRGLYISSENNILFLEISPLGFSAGSVLSIQSEASFTTLHKVQSGEFSFTSSIIESLDDEN